MSQALVHFLKTLFSQLEKVQLPKSKPSFSETKKSRFHKSKPSGSDSAYLSSYNSTTSNKGSNTSNLPSFPKWLIIIYNKI